MSKTNWVNIIWLGTVVALVVNAVAGIWSVYGLVQSQKVVTQTRNVQAALADILSDMKDAETGIRGYVIAEDKDYLKPYDDAKKALPGKQEKLRERFGDNEPQREKFKVVEGLIAEKFEILDRTKKFVENKNNQAVKDMIQKARGKVVMDEIRSQIDEMSKVEATIMDNRSRDVNEKFRSTVSVNILGTSLALLVVSLAYYAVQKELKARTRAEAAVRAANDRLENTVETRTKALSQTSIELLRSNQELEKFAYVASHDLQEPLRKIQAFGDRLKQKSEALDEAGRDYVSRMQASATRMRTLINDLLSYSRVSTQGKPFDLVDLSVLVAGVISDLEPTLDESGGRIDIEPLPTLHADPTQMRQLFQNLLANALKFRRPDTAPVVKVRATPATELTSIAVPPPPTSGWRLIVSDNGIGFDPSYAERIFELFQRLHGRGEYDGTGIGLAVCRKIVERHGGRIVAHSQPGSGTEFVIDLPDLTNPARTTVT